MLYLGTSTVGQSLNVVECSEFRELLLLLRQDLRDDDIPRRTKLRTDVITAWQRYFVILKTDLAVSQVTGSMPNTTY